MKDLGSRIDSIVSGAIAAERLVGAVVIVSKDGRVVHRRAAGLADREAQRPMTEDAIFRLASMSKPITSAAAIALVAAGRLELDAPVTRWLPDFRPRLGDRRPAITVRQLLTHTSGLGYGFLEAPDGPYHRAGVSDGLDLRGPSLAENVRRIGSAPLLYEPGTAWLYSLSIDVLGAVVEAAADRPFPDALRELVTGPLGLADTGFAVTDAERLAVPYGDGPARPRRLGDEEEIHRFPGLAAFRIAPARAFETDAFPSGGGGMLGTADDLVRFFESLRVGPQASLIGAPQTGDLAIADWPGWAHGLGFSVLVDPVAAGTPQSAGTWQWGGAYGHSWFVDPARGLTVVALTNTLFEGMVGGRFPQDLVRGIYAGL